jgi:hypothetical protein
MVRGVFVAALVAGCYRPSSEPACSVSCDTDACPIGLSCGSDGLCYSGTPCDERPDASVDGKQDDADADGCPGIGFVHFCPVNVSPTRTFAGTQIDTTSSSDCTEMKTLVGGETACVVSAEVLSVEGKLVVTGTNPLVLVGREKLAIAATGTIEVGSARNLAECGTPPNGPGQSEQGDGAAGGAGGTLSGLGGHGGARTAQEAVTAPKPGGSLANRLRGGCPGGNGGGNTAGNGFGAGGSGGGAIYLLSGTVIELRGDILAQGSGGFGAPGLSGSPGGGGGGGSGGMIILDAPMVALYATGVLLAAGGGGGAGGHNAIAVLPPQHGATATGASTLAPVGGVPNGCSDCGAGGAGAFAGSTGGNGSTPTNTNAGGGGGGGGAGLIQIFATTLSDGGARVRPPAI